MYIFKEGQELHLRTWEYNCCRMMTELAKLAKERGGKVASSRTAIINNSTLGNKISECERLIGCWERHLEWGRGDAEKTKDAIARKKEELEELKGYEKPVKITHTTYVEFVLDGVRYYYQVDDNPFFEFYYSKTPVTGKRYSRDALLMEDKKDWLYDCFFTFRCTDADVEKAAGFIFDMLINSGYSEISYDYKKVRVPNAFDGGYHYENVPEKRMGTIDY